MSELKNGVVGISSDLTVKPGYTFEEFKRSRYYNNQDGILVIYLDDKINVDGRCYYVSLFFRNGNLYMLSLICCDRYFAEKDEYKRKEYHDKILKSYGIDGTAEYDWGSISSDYDKRGNVSSINLTYHVG